ncbi:hypothetical protein C2W62_13275 [Candidatus Entotheonella serta]|nr:hypothetical protein C2W62_13275 [Candidatus Entotheonella serta]
MTFDDVNETFLGRVRNEAPEAVCDVRVAVILDDSQLINTTLSGNPLQIDGLLSRGRHDFEFPVLGMLFSEWAVMIETFTCDSAPTGTEDGEGPEGPEGRSEGPEGGSEGPEGGRECGGESSDESSPPIPLTDSFSGVFQNQNFTFAFDVSTGAFRGTVENPTDDFICQSRTEIHLGVGAQVIELGPTIPVNLAPGEILNVVMAANGFAPDTYSLHPESSPCP